MKYRRLLKMVTTYGLICTGSGFVLGYFWDYGLSTEGMTTQILVKHAFHSLKTGFLVGGLYFAFPMWLALETFPRPKKGFK